ncbi:MAG TPA: hypothetical protein GX513_04145 [Firmicutes bacterium]|nr:hypothetical protein [Bacillota bacterium]
MPYQNLFLCGPRHSGKTTTVFRVIREVGVPAGGFVVKRVYVRGRVAHFRLVDLRSRQAAVVVYQNQEGAWVPDLTGFEGVGATSIVSAVREAPLVIMDELGSYELGAPRFLAAVREALDAPVPVLGVLKRESNPFLDSVRRRGDTRVVPVEVGSRLQAEQELREWLATAVGSGWGQR